ncbi:MFSD5, partial [Symbiodinium pilosum]
NYGQSSETGSKLLMWDAVNLLLQDRNCLRLCMLVAIFEGSMYVFVSNWTPALESAETIPPHGLVFALFMLAATCGSSVATLGGRFMSPRRQLRIIMLLCVLSFALASRSACTAIGYCLVAFMIFEFCVGWYFPCIGIAKSEIVPDRIRGSMYNLFRVPLNVVVLVLLLTDLNSDSRFALCSLLMFLAMLATFGLGQNMKAQADSREVSCHPAV